MLIAWKSPKHKSCEIYSKIFKVSFKEMEQHRKDEHHIWWDRKKKNETKFNNENEWKEIDLEVLTCICKAWFFSCSWLRTAVSPSPAWIFAYKSSLSFSSREMLSLLFWSKASRFWIFWSLSPICRSTCSRSF